MKTYKLEEMLKLVSVLPGYKAAAKLCFTVRLKNSSSDNVFINIIYIGFSLTYIIHKFINHSDL